MAPSTGFRKTKSAFSPPRPGKSKATTKSTKEKGAARHSLGAMGNSKIHKQQQPRKPNEGQRPKPRKPTRKGVAGTIKTILEEAGSDSNPDEDEDDDDHGAEDENLEDEEEDDDDDDDDNAQEDEDEDEEEEEASLAHDRTLNLSSPEPDFILAEVSNAAKGRTATTTSLSSTTDPPIPLPLIHRIMHAHFSRPDQTSISSDARQLVGKYAEIFVKEAIRRCVDDKRERAAHGTGDAAAVGDTGWMEVEDLERVGVQLCLDF